MAFRGTFLRLVIVRVAPLLMMVRMIVCVRLGGSWCRRLVVCVVLRWALMLLEGLCRAVVIRRLRILLLAGAVCCVCIVLTVRPCATASNYADIDVCWMLNALVVP